MDREFEDQKRVMNLSLWVAVLLLGTKVTAAAITGSSAIYSDAAESVVHLLAVAFAVWALRLSHKPADETHHFGHDKVAFLSAGFEGAMISAAALLIIYEAVRQFVFGFEIHDIAVGATLTGVAAVINLILGLMLVRVGKRRGSPLIRANGIHVLTDVWSSVAVLIALLLIVLTKWKWWDPIAASLAALNILRAGIKLIRESLGGLLDEADPKVEREIRELLTRETVARGMTFHNLRHRHSGRTHWVEFHLLTDDDLTVGKAHDLATEIEAAVAALLHPDGRVISHLEPRSVGHHDEAWEGR
ncbi:cation diffusion facilitator family transporter [Luteolibacter sp. LG18]|uniref:cation diffusion facilitator family transporter n=1 Tax=Luteolibacter sp. LG18 TaxID=2819286 RepID=UPI002B30B88E|nr:cation diffusion facilitator transporter [Luteolibacter sp. LG18]